jgi:hypothetical protein
MDRVINEEMQQELQIGLHSTEAKIKDIEAAGYNTWKEWKTQEYKSKPSNIHYMQEEVLAVQDGKLMTQHYDLMYPEVP